MAEMPTMQLTVHEGEPVYSLGELLAWAVEWAQEPDLHKLDSGERRMYFAEDAATAFLAYIAHRVIGPRLRTDACCTDMGTRVITGYQPSPSAKPLDRSKPPDTGSAVR